MALNLRIPNAPKVYESDYFEQVFRAINTYFSQTSINNANGSINDYSSLPTTGYNLRIGQLYVDAGIVKVVLAGIVYLNSFALTSALGTVTVS